MLRIGLAVILAISATIAPLVSEGQQAARHWFLLMPSTSSNAKALELTISPSQLLRADQVME